MTRIRSKFSTASGGSMKTVIGTAVSDSHGPVKVSFDQSYDFHDRRGMDNPLTIYHETHHYTPWSGTFQNSSNRIDYLTYWPGSMRPSDVDGRIGGISTPLADGLPTAASSGTTAMARTNPSRPVVSLPVAIAELREVPSLFRAAGNHLIKRGAGSYLAYQFGWVPLYNDVKSALNFTGHYDKRSLELARLYGRGGLKRRITLDEGKRVGPIETKFLQSSRFTSMYEYRKELEYKRWATLRWLPTSLPPISSDSDRYRELARGVVTGLSAYKPSNPDFAAIAQDAWNLMPWSWMVDWFSNAGDYLGAHRNAVPAKPVQLNVMTTKRHKATGKRRPDLATGVSGFESGITTSVSLQRVQVVDPVLAADIPFLTGRQMSILGALGVLRLKRQRAPGI